MKSHLKTVLIILLIIALIITIPIGAYVITIHWWFPVDFAGITGQWFIGVAEIVVTLLYITIHESVREEMEEK